MIYTILTPTLDVKPNGDGGAHLTFWCANHPVHGLRLSFDRDLARAFSKKVGKLLADMQGSEQFPDDTKAIHLDMTSYTATGLVLRMRLVGIASQERFKGIVPEMVFPFDSAVSFHALFDKVTGILL